MQAAASASHKASARGAQASTRPCCAVLSASGSSTSGGHFARLQSAPAARTCAARQVRAMSNAGAGSSSAAPAPAPTTAATATGAAAAAGSASPPHKKIGVLFVCLGNICRSPTAEAVFRTVVQRAGLAEAFDIDSCGTGGGNPDWFTEGGWSYHEGDPADSRMTLTARKRGVQLTSRSRPLAPLDFGRFDYIVGMDAKNIRAIRTAADYWRVRPMGGDAVPADYAARLSLMTAYCSRFKGEPEVPDPYYGGPAGFERVLDLLDDACEGLLAAIRQERGL
ncbi:hypothetical protein CHLRE_14g632767v5 [Chlamydomonas reinhardtii]|uniref:Phosphotyrosine protein phosphatase I domain-containing protein n=1 Tax=Chlamydomonas reinhardtii TaxID=3055 RepID=A0A2K3CYU2_CHLRE|nr:uncharacterized protein CHLRE_14g632767v5 [Chlamydomonas reinhardtii]PNW73456.1 hypothetical protein CHLRE_14g632767v5 [Chlamydomonas reinhardtii]